MSRYNDPAHLPRPLEWPAEQDEDEAYERARQREVDADDEADNG